MSKEMKLHLALMQINNITSLLEGNEYQQYLYGHLISAKVEIERQISNLTNQNHSSKMKENH